VERNTRLNSHSFDDHHLTIWPAVERLGDSLIFIGGVNNRNTATVPLATSTQVSMNIARGELRCALVRCGGQTIIAISRKPDVFKNAFGFSQNSERKHYRRAYQRCVFSVWSMKFVAIFQNQYSQLTFCCAYFEFSHIFPQSARLSAACLTTVGTSRLDLYPAGVRQSISTNPADVCVICLAGRCGNVVGSIRA
jgi:hypothetical protein